jgi:cell pole-organizing protein PopZ
MSNAPSLKEPSMEEILASIRRIIESGEERPKPPGDILHGEPASSSTGDDHAAVHHSASWDSDNRARAFAPANADSPSAASVIEPPATVEVSADYLAEPEAPVAETGLEAPAGVFVAELPDHAERPDAVLLDEAPPSLVATRLPRREAMPRRTDMLRDGRSLANAFHREPSVEPAAPVPSEETPHFDDLLAVTPVEPSESVSVVASPALEPAEVPQAETAAVPTLSDRIADNVATDFSAAFDEEQFSSDLRMAVGLDTPAPAEPEPSVIAAASTLMSEAAGAQVAAAFDDLARAIRDGQMKSMEEMAREMLRPMLQEWLDDNLPRIVERMVREEIERVSRGPRR